MSASFQLSMLLKGQDQGARAAVKGVGDEAKRTASETAKLGPKANVAATGMKGLSGQSRMLSQQLSQVAQQGAATGNYMQALTIQAADIGLAFGTLGTVIGMVATLALPAIISAFGGGKAGARGFKSDLEELTEAIGNYRDYTEIAEASTDELAKRFGNAGGRASRLAMILADLEQVETIKKLGESVTNLTERFGGLNRETLVALDTSRGWFASWTDTSTPIGYVTEFENTVRTLREELELSEPQALAVAAALSDMATAGNVQEQVDAAVALNAQFLAVFGSLENIPPELRDAAKQAALIALRATELEGEFEIAEGHVSGILAMFPSIADWIATATGNASSLADEFSRAAANAAAMAQAEASAAANRDALSVALGTNVDETGVAYGSTGALVPTRLTQAQIDAALNKENPGSTGSGSGAAAALDERDAVQDLIASLQSELEVMREIDPVQAEMLTHRETLADATDAERAAVEELIRTRQEEERAMERAEEQARDFSQMTYDALEGLIFEGDSVAEMFENIAMSIAKAALQAALLGTGPMGGMFGSGEGGALGAIFGSLFGGIGQAEGGIVFGRGTGTSDSVPRWLSNGEFVVNAAATQRNRQLLERINAGAALPGLAAGGPVGATSRAGGAGAVVFQPQIVIENNSSAQVDGQIEETTSPSGQRSMRLVLADQVGAAMTQAGGGAKKVLNNRYGVRQRGTRR